VRGDDFDTPRPGGHSRPVSYHDEDGCHSIDIEDGAELFFGALQ
jgi:hypothetical protein